MVTNNGTQQNEVARRLLAEFSGRVPAETIEAVVADSVSAWDDAPIRSYVAVLAERRARERLRDLASVR